MSAKSDPLARFALAALIAFFLPAAPVRAQDVECDQPNEREVRSLRLRPLERQGKHDTVDAIDQWLYALKWTAQPSTDQRETGPAWWPCSVRSSSGSLTRWLS